MLSIINQDAHSIFSHLPETQKAKIFQKMTKIKMKLKKKWESNKFQSSLLLKGKLEKNKKDFFQIMWFQDGTGHLK